MLLCCVCLLETSKYMSLLEELSLKLNVIEIISKHFWFKPRLNDVLTSQICIDCWKKIYDFHQFYQMVKKTHKEYKQKQITIIEEHRFSTSKIKEEVDEDIYESTLMQVEVGIEDSKIKRNDNVVNSKNPLDDDQNRSESDIDCDSEKYESFKIIDQNSLIKERFERSLRKENYDDKKNASKKPNRKPNTKPSKRIDSLRKKRITNRLDPILTEEIVKKHIQMACSLCIYVGKTFSDIIEHFKDHHVSVKPYIMCCDKKFTRSYCIAQHAYIHENPNSFSCTECNKSFTTSYGLRIHNISYHASEEERTHACEHCPRKFGRRNLLELHKQTHIPREQWTIVCTKCTTRTAKFATQYLLNIHTSMYHRRETNICQVCAKEIKDKKSFEKHVRSHFEDSGPRLKCPVANCESWLKDEDNLKTHIQRYHLDDKTYKCPECSKVCPNRRSLSSHKHYFHSKEFFRCEQCNKTFKKALTLKEHMTQHTGETLYSCPFCTRTFNSNANMHSHKKKQHPLEWEELRRKKQGPLPN